MYNNSKFYGSVQGVGRAEFEQTSTQLEEMTNQGQIAGLQIIAESVYNALTTEEKENGKMYFILVGQ